MKIRKSTEQDFERLMEIFSYARKYMAEQGNPNQWGPTNWPPGSLIRSDIQNENSYVCLNDSGSVIGTFFFAFGKEIEPTYNQIYDGAWINDSAYGVVHRIAGDGSEKGIGAFCINWAFEQCGHIRIDTHGDNIVMQNLLKKLGFTHCGTIFIEEDDYPRLAYEKTEIVEKARRLAKEQFKGMTDKSGIDYYSGHLSSVAALVSTDKEKTVAYLHDILEDTDYPEEELRRGFGDEITEAVVLLTHKERMNEEQYLDYISRLASSGNELAIKVKKADLTNNSDYTRLGVSGPEELPAKDLKRWQKYQKALELLDRKI